MLSKINRLRLDKDFKKVFVEGKTAANRFIKIKFIENQRKETRFGFVVSTKFYKKASKRNLIKRRLRAAAFFLSKKIKPGYDIVIWPKEAIKENQDYKNISDNLKELLIKNDILSF